MREILIIVFGKIEFTDDLDKSNFNSIMGTKPDWSERKSGDERGKWESERGSICDFYCGREPGNRTVAGGESVEPRKGF